MDTLIAALFTGTSRGAIYALVAMGLVLVWRGAGIVNFAQMGQAMFSTYIASTLIMNGYSYWLAFFVAIAAGALLGVFLDLVVMRPLSNKKQTELLSSQSMRSAVPRIKPANPPLTFANGTAIHKDISRLIIINAVLYPPTAMSAPWPSEIWPEIPVSITIDKIPIKRMRVTAS